MCPDEVASNRLGAVFEVDRPRLGVAARPRDRHGPLARRSDHGGALRAQLPGLAAGLRPDRPPRRVPLLRGVHPDHRRDGQPVLEVPEDVEGGGPLARAGGRAQLPADLGGVAPGPQRLLAPDAGLHQLDAQPQGGHARVYLPPDANTPAGDHGAGASVHAHDQPRDRLEAPAAAVADDGRGARARREGRVRLGVGGDARSASRTSCSRAAARSRRSSCWPRPELLREDVPELRGALRQRRPTCSRCAGPRPPARHGRGGVRRALHRGQAGDLQLPRLRLGDPPADPRRPAQERFACAATRRRGPPRPRSSCWR